jgi:hypothetical protein
VQAVRKEKLVSEDSKAAKITILANLSRFINALGTLDQTEHWRRLKKRWEKKDVDTAKKPE